MASTVSPEPYKTLCVQLGLLSKAKAEQMARLQEHVAATTGLEKDYLEICVQKGSLTAEQVKQVREEAKKRSNTEAPAAEGAKPKLKELAGFEIIEKVGQGAMGAVFKVRQKSLDRIVALKILPPKLAKNKQFVERFVREARASAALNHPNIVQGIDVGEDQGINYFAMEFIDGETVQDRLKREGKLPLQDVLEIGRQTSLALAHAHHRNVIHRDIKPANLMLVKPASARQGLTVKVMDLGLARALEDEEGHRTEVGSALGTPYYLSPEQARGEQNLTGTCDLYCLGGTLYHLLTGKPPYEGESSAVIMSKHLTQPVPDPQALAPDLPYEVSEIVKKLMAKKPEERYPNGEALADDLSAVLAGNNPKLIKLKGARGKSTGPVGPITSKLGTTGPRGKVTTKPAGAIGARRESEDGKASPKRLPMIPMAIAGVVLLGGLVALFSGGSGAPANTTTAKQSNPEASKSPDAANPPGEKGPSPEEIARLKAQEETKQAEVERLARLDAQKEAALKLDQGAAQDFTARERAWLDLKIAAGGDHTLGQMAEQKLKALGEQRGAFAVQQAESIATEARARAAGSDFDAALAHLGTLDSKLQLEPAQAILERARQEIVAQAVQAGQKQLAPAADLAAAGKWDEAVAAYERAAAFKYQPTVQEARAKQGEAKAKLAERLAAAEKLAQEKFGELLAKLGEALEKREFDAAQTEMRRALADASLAARRDAVEALPAALEGVDVVVGLAGKRLSAAGEKGMTPPGGKSVYYKLEDGRLHYRPYPEFPQVSNMAVERAPWPDLFYLAGLQGDGAVSGLRAVPLDKAEALAGLLALLGEPDHALLLLQRMQEQGNEALKRRAALWTPVLVQLSRDPQAQLAAEAIKKLQEAVANERWDEAAKSLAALEDPGLKNHPVVAKQAAQIAALKQKMPAAAGPALSGLAKLFKGKFTELGDGRVQLEYDWTDAAQLEDFPYRFGGVRVLANELQFFTGREENLGAVYHMACWQPPIKLAFTGRSIQRVGAMLNNQVQTVDAKECWKQGLYIDVGSKELARIFRLGTEVYRKPFVLPPNREPVQVEIGFDGKDTLLACQGQELIRYPDQQPPAADTHNRWGLMCTLDASYGKVTISGKLQAEWVAQALKDPASVRTVPAQLAVAPPPPGPNPAPAPAPDAPVAAPAPAEKKIKQRVQLYAHGNLRWQDTKVVVNAGQQVEIVAEGQWSQGPRNPPVGPDGAKEPLGEWPAMSLLVKRGGGEGGITLVGKKWNGTFEEGGKLFMQANDTAHKDNLGFVTVTITVFE